jgi:ATP-dependent helicase/DNAse subunit B
MTTHFYLAPAGHGKTAYVLERIDQVRTTDPLTPITVILPNQAQVSAFRRRLSAAGGALRVSLGTFYTLYAEVLAWAGKPEPRLPEPVQYRLLRSIIMRLADEGRLSYYAPLRDKPGFAVALRSLLEELKRARIRRDNFREAIQTLPYDTRLAELAEIYTAYQDWLYSNNWADTEGQGWLAALALERRPNLGRRVSLLIVDGFDEFNPTQLAVLKLLVGRATETIITLTGDQSYSDIPQSKIERPALRRFSRARQAISHTLQLKAEPLPGQSRSSFVPLLAYLEANLFESHASQGETESKSKIQNLPSNEVKDLKSKNDLRGPKSKIETLSFLEVQNRTEEARAALRWLKARLVRDKMLPGEVALIARDLAPYRPFIEEVAAEFGLTLHWREGLNLISNPVIAAVMSLLSLPTAAPNGDGDWARRLVIEAWHNPYFENLAPGMTARDADRLDAVARQGLVMRGLDQWREALTQQINQARDMDQTISPLADEDFIRPDNVTRPEALSLKRAFDAFVERLSPPPQATLRRYAAFVEDLIGDDPKLATTQPQPISNIEHPTPESLGIVNRAWAVPTTASRDIAALRAFKDVLRGLVLAEASLRQDLGQTVQQSSEPALEEPEPIGYDRFYEELRGAVQGTTYYPPPPEPVDAALPVLSVLNARGLSFRAVALIGLAEGEFPRAEREDILLREEDRQALRQAGLAALETRLHGDEITFFYQAVTRAREKLLLCRPYLADDGQTWEPSPYWEQVRRLVDVPVQHIRPEDPLPLGEVASPEEFIGGVTQLGLIESELFSDLYALDTAHLLHKATVLQARLAAEPQGLFEGDLTHLAERFSATYGPAHVWSSSRLEAYGLCPHHFWLGQDLALEPRQPPDEGFDVFILGNMYHEILEEVYHQAGTQADSRHLLELLPPIAKKVFDKAPEKYGFRPTPLWKMQRRELEQIVAQTVAALAEATANSTPLAQEQVFGMRNQPPLVVQHDGDEFRVRGFIDRVDQDPDGRLRIIDYKSGSTPIAARDLAEGRRLQIALYALAAREALALGDIADGFYWHIGSAKASSLQLGKFEGNVEGALNTAVAHAFNHVAGVRAGRFAPMPPTAGCPSHCPGANFCWRYKAKGWS